jgi:hypothetical protein
VQGGGGAGARAAQQGASPFMGRGRGACPPGGGGHGCQAGWAPPGQRLGQRGRTGSGLRARPVRIGFLFFLNLFPVRKIIQKDSVNYFEARKILRKSQKFQENS